MANVIDAFLVTLGLDATAFGTGVKQAKKGEEELEAVARRRDIAEKRRQADRERANKQASDGLRKLRNDALALAAVFTAGVGIKNFISDTINSAVNLGYLASNLGMSTERIKAFQLASERAGGTQEGLTAQLKESVDAIAQLNTGGGPNEGVQAFFRWGGSSKDLKDGNTYLLARAAIIKREFDIDPGRAANIAKQMGISEDQFNFIKLGPAAIEDLIKAQEKHAAISAKDAEAALKLKNQMLDLRDSLQQTATRILIQLAPAIERLFSRLERVAQWVAEHQDDIAKWVETTVTGIMEFVRWVDKAAESVGGWKNVLIGLAAVKLTSIVLGLAGIAANLALIARTSPLAAGALGLLGKAGAVGVAGAAGYAAGTYANQFIPEHVKDLIGETINDALAFFGNEDAKYVKSLPNQSTFGNPAAQPSAPVPTAPTVPSNAQGLLTEKELEYGLPFGLLDKIWSAESARGNPKYMMSPAGAEGHFGFMPRTSKEYGLKNPYDFEQSADAAARKMRDLLKQYGGDLQMATAAYNFGQGNLARTGLGGVPKETRDYVAKTAGAMQQAARPSADRAVTSTSTNTSEVNIQNLTVNTRATDANGIARDIKPALEKYSFSNSANTGMIP